MHLHNYQTYIIEFSQTSLGLDDQVVCYFGCSCVSFVEHSNRLFECRANCSNRSNERTASAHRVLSGWPLSRSPADVSNPVCYGGRCHPLTPQCKIEVQLLSAPPPRAVSVEPTPGLLAAAEAALDSPGHQTDCLANSLHLVIPW